MNDVSITNFSMEIEMLNKLHVQKNNLNKISNLPVICDQYVPDPSLSLYKEHVDSYGRLIGFEKDPRHKIWFKDPYGNTKKNSNETLGNNLSEQIH